MGKGKKSLLSFLGLKKERYGGDEDKAKAGSERTYQRKVRPSDNDDNDYWYGEPDIDRKAKEYIEKVRRGISEPSGS